MDDSDLLHFTPVPLRGRRDGWTVRRQYFFILALARGMKPGEAAKILGMSRQSAYNLRDRPGAEGFARAWDLALDRAAERKAEARRSPLFERASNGEWRPRHYAGRVVGWTHREAPGASMRILRNLDKAVARNSAQKPRTGLPLSLEEILAMVDPEGAKPCGS
ncbi:MAG: helix-turn-helix domain-containing protein [Alphaproteobacteria bacterium]|nr:MAG: helix-turn-helix domain-containing protein [Alphaproteobacteria bacterium]